MFYWAQFAQKRGHYRPRPKRKTIFLAEITKADYQLSETFYFIKLSYVLTEFLNESFSVLSDVFFVKKVIFPAKTAVYIDK